jgi:hypothetical protein
MNKSDASIANLSFAIRRLPSLPLDLATTTLDVRQQPLILQSMRNTTPPEQPRVGGIT